MREDIMLEKNILGCEKKEVSTASTNLSLLLVNEILFFTT